MEKNERTIEGYPWTILARCHRTEDERTYRNKSFPRRGVTVSENEVSRHIRMQFVAIGPTRLSARASLS